MIQPPMQISSAGVQFISQWEGFRPTPYKDVNGYWTWGYGHLQMPGEPMPTAPLTPVQGLAILLNDLTWFVQCANNNINVPVNQSQFDAFVSILENVGPGVRGVKDGIITLRAGGPSTLLACLNAGNYPGASAQFPAWDKGAGGIVVQGLYNRRVAEQELFDTPSTS